MSLNPSSISFVHELDTAIQMIVENTYTALSANTWWSQVADERPSVGRKQRVVHFIGDAGIKYIDAADAQVAFDRFAAVTQEYENKSAAGGLEISVNDMTDAEGYGYEQAQQWAAEIGSYGAYWPQQALAAAILANPTAYDGLPFFSASHLVHPSKAERGTFANDFTGAATSTYPGALPIDSSVTIETAINNLAKLRAYIATVKNPSGVLPRGLRLVQLVVPPALETRAELLCAASLIAMSGGSAGAGAGSTDVSPITRTLSLGKPIVAPELSAAFGGSDSTYYAKVEAVGSVVGAWTYYNREPFQVISHNPSTSAELMRSRKFQWMVHGRNVIAPAHPFKMLRIQAS